MDFNIEETMCFTGHRPNKLYGYDKTTPGNIVVRDVLADTIKYAHEYHGINNFISGMAQGADNWAALEVINLRNVYPNMKLICAIPCQNFYEEKNKDATKEYLDILDKADKVHYVSNRTFFSNCLQRRNEWMVDNSIGQIAVWNGSRGGTKNCIDYANLRGKKKRFIINPKTFTIKIMGL